MLRPGLQDTPKKKCKKYKLSAKTLFTGGFRVSRIRREITVFFIYNLFVFQLMLDVFVVSLSVHLFNADFYIIKYFYVFNEVHIIFC